MVATRIDVRKRAHEDHGAVTPSADKWSDRSRRVEHTPQRDRWVRQAALGNVPLPSAVLA
jgi:hypothetical protein